MDSLWLSTYDYLNLNCNLYACIKMLGKNESYGGFSDKGFDIGNTTDIDTQSLGYILRRLDKEFSFGNI